MRELSGIFGPDGALAQQITGFRHRAAQQEMAGLVASAIEHCGHTAIEAGTGIGKTFAYLVPALLSGRRVIVSTGTKTLQDQLFSRDLPLLGRVLGRPVPIALLKGRSNYLCHHRLRVAQSSGRQDAETLAALESLRAFGLSSDSGDLNELDDMHPDWVLRNAVTSTVDNCLGNRCPDCEQCFVLKARQRAQRSRVVVVNHHLLLADMTLKAAGFGELLPDVDVVIVDESHLFPDIAQNFFGVSVTSGELERLIRDVDEEAYVGGFARELAEAVRPLRAALAEARSATAVAAGDTLQRMGWEGGAGRHGELLGAWQQALEELAESLSDVGETNPGLARCRERCLDSMARTRRIREAETESGMRWLERKAHSLAARWIPVDAGTPLAEAIENQGGTWIFTSATLAVREDCSHFAKRVGLPAMETRVLPSPFDYRNNARLYLPQGLPMPGGNEHTEALLHGVWPLIQATDGGAFLLFTSYRALHVAEEFVSRQRAPGPVFVQGKGPRSQLLERFRAAGNALLLGTGSFWQGVDVRGPALRFVLIDKLPFAVPGDPMVEARIEAIRREGGDPFKEVQLPQAVLALKQGAGRLIRDFDDCGLIVFGDPRIRTRPYGRIILDSLPAMTVVDEMSEAMDFAGRLARPPTKVGDETVESALGTG